MKKKVLLSGSLSYDSIYTLTSPISEQVAVEKGKAGKQNLMLTASDKEVFFGGTAGNQAYGLSLLGVKPLVASIVGKDFGEYSEHLKKLDIESRIQVKNDGYTAHFSCFNDTKSEQIGIWQGGIYYKYLEKTPLSSLLKDIDWKDIAIGLFSPGVAKSLISHLKEFKKKKRARALSIFDPGQTLIVSFTPKLLEEALRNADIVIANENECSTLHNHFKFDLRKIFSFGVKAVIETKGSDGSSLYELVDGEIKETKVSTPFVKKPVDPTGAGDAFRAGLVKGLLDGKTIAESMRIGAKLGAACVKKKGAQGYK